jgi:hypothetical protein
VTQYWVGVASRDHVIAAGRDGFCQFNHGKEAPIKRLRLGDRLVYYSLKTRMRAGDHPWPIAPGSPWQNGFAEKLIGSIRRECADDRDGITPPM